MISPFARRGIHFCICSKLPNFSKALETMVWTVNTPANEEDPLPKASFSNPNVTVSHPCPPCSCGRLQPKWPDFASIDITDSGIFCSRSHSSANGSTFWFTNALKFPCLAFCCSVNKYCIGALACLRGYPLRVRGPNREVTMAALRETGSAAMNSPRSLGLLPAVLPHDKSRGRVKGLEILDVQIVRPYFYRKSFFEERHQLDRK